jgi:hypothetical protein
MGGSSPGFAELAGLDELIRGKQTLPGNFRLKRVPEWFRETKKRRSKPTLS